MHRAPVKVSPEKQQLVEALLSPAAFEHPVTAAELIETHISWLILAGDFVYKIKKPVVLDFLDFGSLERRRHFCEEEVRLNQPSAPKIYLGVVPISRVDGRPRFNAAGAPIEYAVRMRRFDQDLRLDKQLENGELTVADMKELGRNIASRHAAAPVVPAEQRERVLRLTREFMEDNLAALEGYIDPPILSRLAEWTESELQRCQPMIDARFDDGFVRDCHGDLHLGNLVRLADGITTFDCIEFNADLRHIDVMCDIAFLVMDLVAKARQDLAAHFLNRYLEATGDYAGVPLLNLFFVYRCLVRAKVAAIRSEERDAPEAAATDLDEAQSYCDMAMRQSRDRPAMLIVMHGLSGSGKTWVSSELMAALPAIRVRSDVERRRLFGLDQVSPSGSDVGGGIYAPAASERVYARLFASAAAILEAGHHVILDAAFLDEASRAGARGAAGEAGAATVIVEVTAPDVVMRQRLADRSAAHNDPSEADAAVLDYQQSTAQALCAEEARIRVACENDGRMDVADLVDRIRDTARRAPA